MASLKLRPIQIEGNVAYIALTRGHQALIDAADVHLIDRWNWHARIVPNTVYAGRQMRSDGRLRTVFLHREIMRPPLGAQVDHINGDGLDNRRSNLRLASCAENTRNRALPSNNASGFKGVTWSKVSRKWQAQIGFGGRQNYIGRFDTPEEAYAAYCQAAALVHGEFVRKT